MRACQAAAVQRVSVTSSVASVYEMEPEDEPEIYNESHWTDVNKRGLGAYTKSKVMAERAAWEVKFWNNFDSTELHQDSKPLFLTWTHCCHSCG